MLVAGDRLYLSTDSGHTFLPVLDRRVDVVAYDPRNRRLAYAAVGGTLLRSVDARPRRGRDRQFPRSMSHSGRRTGRIVARSTQAWRVKPSATGWPSRSSR